jgi:hypothetical protein
MHVFNIKKQFRLRCRYEILLTHRYSLETNLFCLYAIIKTSLSRRHMFQMKVLRPIEFPMPNFRYIQILRIMHRFWETTFDVGLVPSGPVSTHQRFGGTHFHRLQNFNPEDGDYGFSEIMVSVYTSRNSHLSKFDFCVMKIKDYIQQE